MSQVQKKQLTIKEMKRITYEIVDEENRKHNLDIKAFPVTLTEYYKEIFRGKISLKRVAKYIHYPACVLGMNFDGVVLIFLSNIKRLVNVNSTPTILTFLESVYHELRHGMQQYYDPNSYEMFLHLLEDYMRLVGPYYENSHDYFSFEIGANLYGIRKAAEYLRKNYPEIYESQKKAIEEEEKKYMFNYYMYDASIVFDIAVPIARTETKRTNTSRETIFMNADGSFKRIREMLENPTFHELDERIVSAIMSSGIFLGELDFGELSYIELEVLNKALNYTVARYNNQLEYLENYLREHKLAKKDLSRRTVILERRERLQHYIDSISLYMTAASHIENKGK